MSGNTHISFIDSPHEVFYFSDDMLSDDPIISGDLDVLNNLSTIKQNGVTVGLIKFRHFCPTYYAAEIIFIDAKDAERFVNGEFRIETRSSITISERKIAA